MEEKQRTKPTESQIKVLMSDWLGNLRVKDEGNYTHSGSAGIRVKDRKPFSTSLIGSVSGLCQEELLKSARQAAVHVVNAITDEPADVHLGGNGSYQTYDGRGQTVINLATDFFDDSELNNRQKIDVLLGLASHESAHAVFTDESLSMVNIKNEPQQTAALKKDIWNIIEDERIEYLLGDKRPGLSETLGATKEYYFKKLTRRLMADGKRPTEPLPKLLSTLTLAVRYPSEMQRDDVEDCFDELDAIRKVLTPYPLTPEDTWKATDRIMDVIREKAKKEMQDQQQQQSKQGSGNGSSPSNEGGSSSGEEKKPNEKKRKDGGKSQSQPEPTAQEVAEAIRKALSTEEGQKVMDAIHDDSRKADPRNSCQALSVPGSSADDFVNSDDSEAMGGGAGNPTVFITKPKGDPEKYRNSLRRVRAFIPAMSKALACKSRDTHYVLHGLPEGKLNTNKLVSLKCGNTRIFDKKGSVTCSGASVLILIDESGSMGSGSKLTCAREAAILIKETVDRINNVNFFCYGYTDCDLRAYGEGPRSSRYALSETRAKGGTPTGMAMRYAAQRVRRFTKDPVLMLVLTDGAANSSTEVVMEDTRLRNEGFIPIGIGILTSAVKSTFREYVVVNDMSHFAIDLGKLTKGKLDKMLVRHEA